MTTDVILFLLRLISGLALIAFLVALFVILWKDYRSAVQQVSANRRVYGQLIVLRELDGHMLASGETYPLLPLTSLGRAPTNSIIISDSFASSEHAVVMLKNGQWWLEDRQSRNGTTLNGMPVTQSIIITDGDIIGIGKLHFRVELEA